MEHTVERVFGLPHGRGWLKRRKRVNTSPARKAFVILARERTILSSSEIASIIGCVAHSSVFGLLADGKRLEREDPVFLARITACRSLINMEHERQRK